MTRAEQMELLIKSLIAENPRMRGIAMPECEPDKWGLLRSLMNIRHPGPARRDFLQVQDALLTGLTAEKGIVTVGDLPAVTGEPELTLWRGDITTLKVDAIVNAANSTLLGCFRPCHSCIDNAIHTYAGVQLREECGSLIREQGHDEPAGSAKITKGYNLPCKYILHTVGPVISGHPVSKADDRLLQSCYRSCLELAAENRLESVAFCCVSTGVFRFPRERAANIAVHTVREYLSSDTSVKRVVFNVFTEEDRAVYQRILESDS